MQLLLLSSLIIAKAADLETGVIPGAYIVEFADHLDNVSCIDYSAQQVLTDKA